MTMITLVRLPLVVSFVVLSILSSIHVQVQVISPLPITVDNEIHWVWIIRLIDEIILLSAIFPLLLVSYWGCYRAENRH